MFNFFSRKKSTPTLFYKTDVHSHLVPGVDDGSRNVETSISLIKGLYDIGIRNFLITPHVNSSFDNTPATLKEPYAELTEALSKENLDITFMHSAEYRLDEFFFDNVMKNNEYMLLPNNYILIENSFIQESMNFRQVVFDLKSLGYKPILAHPERYFYYIENKERYMELHNYEILLQVNLLSFTGYYGKDVKKTAWWLLDNGLIDFLGSDLHHPRGLECIKKFLSTSDYKKIVEKANIMNDTAFV